MGIKGLWQLLLPTGRRISIETLAGKRLAVDASIWLTQFLKANRDPETGKVRANAHLIGFLRRVCKLLFHGIRPIFVFDGATPEIKLREIRERRKRRERLHNFKSEDGNEGVKRLARRILVATLKKQKELEKAQEKMEDGKNVKNPMEVLRNANSKSTKNTGAFASGFTLPGEEDAEETVDGSKPVQQANVKGPNEIDDVLVLSDSEDYLKTLTQEQQNTNNDWDTAIAAAHSESEESENSVEIPDDQALDIEILTNLPSKARVGVIEKARRQQRMLSRQEFMSVAANPDSYSQCQLKNFLKSASLNKTVNQLGKIVAKKGEDGLQGERIASDGTRRFIFEKDGDNDNIVAENKSKRRSDLIGESAPTHRKRLKNFADKTQAVDSDDEIFDQQEQSVKYVDLFDDESDSEGGGFIVQVKDAARQQNKPPQHIAINSSDDSEVSTAGGFIREDNMSDEGGFMSSNSRSAQNDAAIGFSSNDDNGLLREEKGRIIGSKIRLGEEVIEVGSSSDEDGGGCGFIPAKSDDHAAAILENNLAEEYPSNIGSVKQGMDYQDSHESQIVEVGSQAIAVDKFSPSDHGGPSRAQLDQRMERKRIDKDEIIEVGSTSDNSIDNFSVGNACGGVGRALDRDDEDGDASNESIDWEDGDDSDSVECSGLVVSQEGQNHSKIRIIDHESTQIDMAGKTESGSDTVLDSSSGTTSAAAIEPSNGQDTNEDESSDSIVWEDCSDNESIEETCDRTTEAATNNFLTPANAAALINAQATASHLTDWAGRAVERAIKAHLNETIADHKQREEDSGQDDADEPVAFDNIIEGANVSAQENEDIQVLSQTEAPSSENVGIEPSPKEFMDTSLDALQREDAFLRGEENRRERDMDTITDEMVEEVMQLLQLFGIPYLKAPAEAEAQAVELEKLGLVDGVVTEDSDAIVFGSKSVYRNIFSDKKYVEVYSSSDSESIGLRHNEKVALAMLLGGDYTEGVKGVGIVNGMEILKAFPVSSSIETGLKKFRGWLDGFDLNDNTDDEHPNITEFRRKHKSARSRWVCPKDFPSPTVLHAYSNPVVDSSKETFTWTEVPDIDALRRFCLEKMGWERSETDRAILPVVDEMRKGVRQTRLDGFFMRSEDNIKFADVKSKRLRQVWNLKKKNEDIPEES